jgi:hypothetical protein
LQLNLVRVRELNPPENEQPVEWLLYTSEPIDSDEQVLKVVDWYRARWTIEIAQTQTIKTRCTSRCIGAFSSFFAGQQRAA